MSAAHHQPSDQPVTRVNALTLRGVVVGIVCVVITCFVVCYAEIVVGKIQLGYMQLPPAVIGMLVMLVGAQAVFRRFAPKLQLQPRELYSIYVMMLIAAMVSSRGILEKLIALLIVPNYFADATNHWHTIFFKYIPRWAVPWNPAGPAKQPVATGFYNALHTGQPIPWNLWVVPLCAWGLFVAFMMGAMICLAALLRKQWVDNEKLTFPLVQLPLEMISGRNATSDRSESFLQNRFTWLGFALPMVVFGFNGLHQYLPSIPDITTQVDLSQYLTSPPWNGIGLFTAYFTFAAVGFFYLLPTDLLFSLWFFFMLTRVENVLARSWGYQPVEMPMYPCKQFVGYQVMGAYVVLAGYMVYTARGYIKTVWHSVIHGSNDSGDQEELLSPRVSVGGLAVCVLLMTLWLHMLGMDFLLALFTVCTTLFLVGVVLARSTAEAGMLMTETSFRPVDMYRLVADPRSLSGANITAMAFMDGFMTRDQRGLLLTGFLDSLKFADGVQVRRRSLVAVFILALVVSILTAGWLHVTLPYKLGAVQMYSYVYTGNPVWAFQDAQANLAHTNPPPAFANDLWFAVGMLVTGALVVLRTTVSSFPLNPLGYALCGSWTMKVFWFPCMVAWIIKVLVLRYGGMNLYRRLRPFFLGLVLGEFTVAVLFTLPAIINRFIPTPLFPWP